MQWILLLVIVVSLFYLSRYFPKTAFSILGALVIGAGVMVLTTTEMAQFNRGKIAYQDIQIENPVLTPTYAEGYRFNTRLFNANQTHSLRELVVSITMLDCASDDPESCRIIGQENERINVGIPPGQARDVARTLSFDNAVATGILKWEFKVTSTRS